MSSERGLEIRVVIGKMKWSRDQSRVSRLLAGLGSDLRVEGREERSRVERFAVRFQEWCLEHKRDSAQWD